MSFEWDEEKNRRNIERHGVRFEDAQKIFDGPVLTRIDDREDYGEIREISLGLFDSVVVLVVVHTDRDGVIRLISARKAMPSERKVYEQTIQKSTNR